MHLALPTAGLASYTSKSQRSGIASEEWAGENLYCPNCKSRHIEPSPVNTPAIDFACPRCRALFQLKAKSSAFGGSIADAAYDSMVRAIRENRTPNLFALHYRLETWTVVNVFLIPEFAFPLSAIQKRPPLRPGTERAGWVGCNILLGAIPKDARIPIVVDGVSVPAKQVREQYGRMRPLKTLRPEQRGWTLDVLNAVRSLNKRDFSLSEVYELDDELAALHPANQHVRDKIRQQLQVLRDLRLLEFLGRGSYRLAH